MTKPYILILAGSAGEVRYAPALVADHELASLNNKKLDDGSVVRGVLPKAMLQDMMATLDTFENSHAQAAAGHRP